MRRTGNHSTNGRATGLEVALVVMLICAAVASSALGNQLVIALGAMIANLHAA